MLFGSKWVGLLLIKIIPACEVESRCLDQQEHLWSSGYDVSLGRQFDPGQVYDFFT